MTLTTGFVTETVATDGTSLPVASESCWITKPTRPAMAMLVAASHLLDKAIHVDSFWWALLTAFVASAVTVIFDVVLGANDDDTYTLRVTQRIARRSGERVVTDTPGIIYLEIDGLALPVLRRAMRDGNAPHMLVVLLVYQQVENNFLTPKIQGKAVNLSGFFIIVAVTLFGALLGVLGALTAVPLAATIQIFIQELTKTRREKVAAARAALGTPAPD